MPRKAPVYAPLPTAQQSSADLLADGVLKVKDAVKFSGLCRDTIYALIREGKLKSFLAGRLRVIPKRALVAYLSELMEARP